MNRRLLLTVCVLAFAGCVLPWSLNPGAGLTFNLLDLAEWSSLHPAVHAQQPPMLTSLLLRMPWVALALLLALNSAGRWRFTAGLAVALIAAGLLPPFEFLSSTGDPNYRQQALTAGVALGAGLAAFAAPQRARPALVIAISALALLAALAGLADALHLMRELRLPTLPGPGALLFVISMGILAAGTLVNKTGPRIARRPASASA